MQASAFESSYMASLPRLKLLQMLGQRAARGTCLHGAPDCLEGLLLGLFGLPQHIHQRLERRFRALIGAGSPFCPDGLQLQETVCSACCHISHSVSSAQKTALLAMSLNVIDSWFPYDLQSLNSQESAHA